MTSATAAGDAIGHLQDFRIQKDIEAVKSLTRIGRLAAGNERLSEEDAKVFDEASVRLRVDPKAFDTIVKLAASITTHETAKSNAARATADLDRVERAAKEARRKIEELEVDHEKSTASLRRKLEQADAQLAERTQDWREALDRVEPARRLAAAMQDEAKTLAGEARHARSQIVELLVPEISARIRSRTTELRRSIAEAEELEAQLANARSVLAGHESRSDGLVVDQVESLKTRVSLLEQRLAAFGVQALRERLKGLEAQTVENLI